MEILVFIIFVFAFTAMGLFVGYKVGYTYGYRAGYRAATGGTPLNEKAIRKRYKKI